MPKLVISPQAGFGNRLRALASGIAFGVLTGRDVYHYWITDEGGSQHQNVSDMKRFEVQSVFDLQIPKFEGQVVDVCFSEWVHGDYWHAEQSSAQKVLTCRRTVALPRSDGFHDTRLLLQAAEDTVLLETSLEVHLPGSGTLRNAVMQEVYRTYFRLVPVWQHFLDQLPTFDYGLSVRKGAFLEFFPNSDQSIDQLVSVIDQLRGSKIIFSDDRAFATELRQRVGAPFYFDEAAYGSGVTDSIMAQFLTLSKCSKVYGTRDSSFAEQAALFGGKPYRNY